MKSLSIYIHIPFCNSKCYYCNFCSFVATKQEQKLYFDSLKNEIKMKAVNFINKNVVRTIYFGGGTPSAVNPKYIKEIIEIIRKNFLVADDVEITIELNPNSTNKEKLQKYISFGINRISIGVQSFKKKSLIFVGRINKEEAKYYSKSVLSLIKNAKAIGFKNISADFIIGLPFQSYFALKNTIKKLRKQVTHFSCYMLEVDNNTKLKQLIKKPVPEKILITQYKKISKFLIKKNFNKYEISNFSKIGFESKHNLNYWERGNYIGFGLAAHSLIDNIRLANTDNFNLYVNNFKFNINRNELLKKKVFTEEKLFKQQIIEEIIMLSLRTKKGINLLKFKEKYFDLEEKCKDIINLYKRNNLLVKNKNSLCLTEKGILVENEIIVGLISKI